jgi:hypothetical protein
MIKKQIAPIWIFAIDFFPAGRAALDAHSPRIDQKV